MGRGGTLWNQILRNMQSRFFFPFLFPFSVLLLSTRISFFPLSTHPTSPHPSLFFFKKKMGAEGRGGEIRKIREEIEIQGGGRRCDESSNTYKNMCWIYIFERLKKNNPDATFLFFPFTLYPLFLSLWLFFFPFYFVFFFFGVRVLKRKIEKKNHTHTT